MRPIALSLSASLLALSFAAVPSVARAEEPAPSFFPSPALVRQALSPARALGPSLFPSLPGADRPLRLQIDPGDDVQRSITLTWADDGSALATIYVFTQAIGSFKTGEEYWYVNRNTLHKLGSANFTIAVTDSNSLTPPGDPGYSSEQKFTQLENVSWGSGWTTDPVSGGFLYSGPTSYYLRLKISTLSPPTVTDVIWYQVLSSGTPANIDPAGSWTSTSGSVPVPGGSTGYDINQTNG